MELQFLLLLQWTDSMPHLIQQEDTSNNRKPILSIQRRRFSRKQITRFDIKQRDPFVKHRSTILHSPGLTLSIVQVQHPLMIRVRKTHPTTSHESTFRMIAPLKALSFHLCLGRLEIYLRVIHISIPLRFGCLGFQILLPQPLLNLKRILKRRDARRIFQEKYKCAPKGTQGKRRPYMHESRHRHAMRRPRGPGGRYLTKEQIRQTRTGSN